MGKIATQRRMTSGLEALLRFPILQRGLDQASGKNTAGFISGYRGSPIAGYDRLLWRNADLLEKSDITFKPGLNEDLAATAVWGTQIAAAYAPMRVDGIFGIWYGKGPGVDRSGDVLRHANMQGTSRLGGVVAIAGDDHAAQSSTLPHQTDGIFQSTFIPVFQPADIEDIISMGLSAIALSRYSGLWTAMKTVAEVMESAMIIDEVALIPACRVPEFDVPAHGLNWDRGLSLLEGRFELERRLIEERLPAAKAWIAANQIDRVEIPVTDPMLCLVTTGKAHQDVMQALADLGIGKAAAERLGLGVFKVGISWPLSTQQLDRYFPACPEYLVFEEKQPIIESQLKSAFFNQAAYRASLITGKFDDKGRRLLNETFEFTPGIVAKAILDRLEAAIISRDISREGDIADIIARARSRLAARDDPGTEAAPAIPTRKPFFCAGCPHNSSLNVPDGMGAAGGIGCHAMAVSQAKFNTDVLCHMGGEGAQWIGAQSFSKKPHLFQNLGDGTYQHSGSLAIRAAISAGARITFKILYNDAVAMTGGQAAEGNIDPARITRQLRAEGIEKIALVSDAPDAWRNVTDLAPNTRIEGREALGTVQRDFSTYDGVSAIIYEQTCAAEKRRRRKKKLMPDPDKRLFINARICEGCGDCSDQSNCIAIEPLETPFGVKRQINQSSCNKDMSCARGFCPSFIEVVGARRRKPEVEEISRLEETVFDDLEARTPPMADIADKYDIFVTGIGGTGVLTLGAILGEAAELDGLEASVLDFTGLAQKNGTVVSHVRLAPAEGEVHAVRIPDGEANLLIAADYLAASHPSHITKLSDQRSRAIVNTHAAPTADHVQDRNFKINRDSVIERLRQVVTEQGMMTFDFTLLAQRIFGDTIAANMMMIGFACERGWLPLSTNSIEQAIARKGVAVTANIRAFNWGRVLAHDAAIVDHIKNLTPDNISKNRRDLTALDRYIEELADYQNGKYADIYRNLMLETKSRSRPLRQAGDRYYETVEKYAYKLMAYKDEYEVARLYGASDYLAKLRAEFSSWRSINIWLAPPALWFARKDDDGRPRKRKFGPWVLILFRILRHFKFLRGTAFDLFGYTQERRAERRLAGQYLETVRYLNENLSDATIALAQQIAALPDDIRGFGPVKLAAIDRFDRNLARLLKDFSTRSKTPSASAP